MAIEIVTKAELGTYIDRQVGDGSRDDLIRLGVISRIEKVCNRTFSVDTADRAEKIDVLDDYTTEMVLENPPVDSFTSLQSGRTTLTLVDADSYVVKTDSGIIKKITGFWTRGVNYYTANYKGGYTAIPADLRLLGMSIMARDIAKADNKRHGMRGRNFQGGGSDFFQLELEPWEREILEGYVLHGATG